VGSGGINRRRTDITQKETVISEKSHNSRCYSSCAHAQHKFMSRFGLMWWNVDKPSGYGNFRIAVSTTYPLLTLDLFVQNRRAAYFLRPLHFQFTRDNYAPEPTAPAKSQPPKWNTRKRRAIRFFNGIYPYMYKLELLLCLEWLRVWGHKW
jgi:hypothetical protein